MNTITLSKNKYQELKQKAADFERLRTFVETKIFIPPPVRDRKKIISEFQKTRLYNAKFLKSLERGLARSSYFRK